MNKINSEWKNKCTKRKDKRYVSTIKPPYGKYETAIITSDEYDSFIRITEIYNTAEEAKKGHEKYVNMSSEDIDKIKPLS